MKIQPNPAPGIIQRERHILAIPRCCPVSKNPLPESTLTISYIPGATVLEVAALKGYIHRYIGGLRDEQGEIIVRTMEGLVVQVARDCANVLGVRVMVYAHLHIAPSQQMCVRAIAFPEVAPEEGSSNPVSQAPLPTGTNSVTDGVAIDTARQQLAVTFARSRQRVTSLYTLGIGILTALVTFAFLSSGFPVWLDTLVSMLGNAPVLSWQPLTGWYPLLVLVYFVLGSILLLALTVPLAWYTSFAIPRRYGLRKGTTWYWLGELGKSLIIFCTRIWLFIEVIALLLAVQPQTWWAWAALIQFLFSLLATRFISLRLVPLFRKLELLSEGELTRRLHALLVRLHIPACSLFQAKVSHRTTAANAFFTGWGNGRRIILTDTLTKNFTLDEIEVILAHELGHLVHHDIWTRLVMRGLTFLGIFYLISLYLTTFPILNDSSSSSVLLSLLQLLVPVVLLLFMRFTVRYRRHQEYQADEFALRTTGNVQAFKSAMTRLTNMNLLVATSTRRARHPRSHPTLVKRLQHADEFAARLSVSAK